MALTPAEEAELQALEAELAPREIGLMKGLGRGLDYSMQRASRGVADTAAWLGSDYIGKPLKNWAMSKGLVPNDAQLEQAKQLKDEAGIPGTIGAVGGDMATQLIPGAAISKSMQIAGRAAPLLGEMASSAALNTAFAPDAEKVEAAKEGAIGGAAGKVLAKTIGGPLRNLMTPDSKALTAAGITLPAGQMISGTGAGPIRRAFAGAETGLSRIPILGAPLKYRVSTAIEDYNKQQLNSILEPFGKTVTAGGRKGLEEAQDTIRRTFEEVSPNLYIDDYKAASLLDNFTNEIKKTDTTVSDRVLAKVREVLAELEPHAAKGPIDGPEAFRLGKKLDFYADKYAAKTTPDNADLNRAFRKLSSEWTDLFEPKVGADPAYANVARELQAAKRQWYKFRNAADMTIEGFFTPAQVIKANKGYAPNDVTRAASHIMPKTAPEINVGSNALLHKFVTPGGVSGAAALGSYTGLGALTPLMAPLAVGAAAYTKPALKYLERGATPLLSKLLRKKDLDPDQVESVAQTALSQYLRSKSNMGAEE